MTADRGKSRNRRELVALLFALCFAAGTALAAPAADVTDQFYDPEAVQTIHLEIKAEDLDRLHRALPQRICVPRVFSWKGHKLENVGVRYKGNSSSNPDASRGLRQCGADRQIVSPPALQIGHGDFVQGG
jgi:hypothetical protein